MKHNTGGYGYVILLFFTFSQHIVSQSVTAVFTKLILVISRAALRMLYLCIMKSKEEEG